VDPDRPPAALERRSFLARISLALGGLAAAIASLPPLAFVFGPLAEPEPDVWRVVGPVDKFAIGSTVEVIFTDPSPEPWAGVSAEMGAWLRRESETGFTAFSLDCTHLGCPVRWLPAADLFMCPCHGGVFYRDGRVAAGPPAKPLQHHPVRVRDGHVEVRTRPIPIIG
jgi:quinol---cytochrome c reductase iron-sulfur subunit, bacillus type